MLLTLVVCFAIIGSCRGLEKVTACYGKSVKFPQDLAPPLYNGPLYFSPSSGGEKKILADNGVPIDPRLKLSFSINLKLTQLTEQDEGFYGISFGGDSITNILSLKVLDCAVNISSSYMRDLSYEAPRRFDLVEFSPFHSRDPPVVLWDRSDGVDTNRGRLQVKRNRFLLFSVSQSDSGYYNFWEEDKTFVSRMKFTVREETEDFIRQEHERLTIDYPRYTGPWTVTFVPRFEGHNVTIIKAGQLVRQGNPMYSRMEVYDKHFEIIAVERFDEGIFEFRDPDGNLVFSARLIVAGSPAAVISIVVAVLVAFGLILCCCCYCCKRGCCKKNAKAPAQTEPPAGPKVYYHDTTQRTTVGFQPVPGPTAFPPSNYHPTPQPTAPGYPTAPYSAAYPPQTVNAVVYPSPSAPSTGPLAQPTAPGFSGAPVTAVTPPQAVNTVVSIEPSAFSSGSTVYQPAGVNVNILQPEGPPPAYDISAPGPSFGSNFLAASAEPSFEVKGLNFPSASPIGTETPSADTYNSEKLNFL